MAILRDLTNKAVYADETIHEAERTIMAGPITFDNLTVNGAITITGSVTFTATLTVQGTDARLQVI
tara:strand:+ start:153 stop:350 length:198 start_codon:yes stop_codon:yes gene_type:complete